jgi:hypothetical protein
MMREELPAIISLAILVAIFLAAFWQDTRRFRDRLASLDETMFAKDEESFFFEDSSADEAQPQLSQQQLSQQID